MSQLYYQQLGKAFDQAAHSYDEQYGNNTIMAWMRSESLAVLRSAFSPGSRLLEIGCGTGEEAIALSQLGYRIVATDISAAMIQVAQEKATMANDVQTIWRLLPAGHLAHLLDEFGPSSFDGAYASFGALNCEPDLHAVVRTVAALLDQGALLVCSVMNRWCAWEILWGLAHLRPREAFRRISRGLTSAGLASPRERLMVPVRFYTPGGFARRFIPHFQVQSAYGLPVLLPPPYLDYLVRQRWTLLARMTGCERRVRGWYPLRALGDHFLLVMVRTASHRPC